METLHGTHTRRNHKQAGWRKCPLQIALFQVNLCCLPQQGVQHENHIQHHARLWKTPLSSSHCGHQNSQDVHQMKTDQLLEDLNRAIALHDDSTMFAVLPVSVF